MEQGDVVWEGRVGSTPLRVGVPHAGMIIAEWSSPSGPRHKVSDSVEQFERSVLFQLLLAAGEEDQSSVQEVLDAVARAEAERPRRSPPPAAKKRKPPHARRHRRSRTPPRR